MPRFIQLSAACHVAAAGWAFAQPHMAPWALGGMVVNHLAIAAAGLWPRSQWLGPNVTRLPGEQRVLALTIDDGPDPEVTPAVLDMLDQLGLRATFFCIAQQAERHPALTRQIVARGHDIQNHSFRHPHTFSLYGPAALRREVERAQEVLLSLTGRRPTCFRAPAGLRNPFLDPVLHRLGLHLVSWTRRGFDTREPAAPRVLQRLTRGLAAGDILLLHDRHAARGPQGRPVLLDVLPALAQQAAALDLRWVGLSEALPARAGGGEGAA